MFNLNMKLTMKSTNQSFTSLLRKIACLSMFAFIILATSCSDDDAGPDKRIKLASSGTLGNYLTDADGNTLYFFSNDAAGANTCTGGCATAWPIFFEASVTADMLSDGLSLDDFGSITT